MTPQEIEEMNKVSEKILDILFEYPYFEACLILRMCDDTLRLTWMNNVVKEGGFK